MVDTVIAFFVGLFLGGSFGFLCAVLAIAVGRYDHDDWER